MLFLTKNSKLLAVAGVIIVAALFYVVTYPDLESGENMAEPQNERWELAVVERPRQPDIGQMLDGGFWGKTASPTVRQEPEQSPELLAEEQAVEIRKRIHGIVSANGESDQLAVIYEAERLVAGDALPGTGWELLSVGTDRLILEQAGQTPKELRLFYDSTFTVESVNQSTTSEDQIQQ